MRTRRAAGGVRLVWCWLVIGSALAACDRVRTVSVEQEQDADEPTPDPLPGVGVSDATEQQLMTACRGLDLAAASQGAQTTLANTSLVTILPAKGTHKVTEADLADGRMVSRVHVDSGPGIPEYSMVPGDTACLLIVGPNYDALQTIFVSIKTGQRLDTLPTAVIHKARVHPHAEADWIAISGASLIGGLGESGARGMIPWLFPPPSRVKVAQTSCGKYQCCVPAPPPQ